jgi:hypothetical protein
MTTPQYNAPYPGQMPAEPPKGRGPAIAALILGIIGIILGFTFCLSWLGALLGLVGLILGIVGLMGVNKSPGGRKGLPIAGIIASVAAILIGLVITIVGWMYAVQFAEWGIKEGMNADANRLADEARARGVDDATITAARARLDAALENGPESFEDMERYTREVEQAMQDYRDALQGTGDDGAIEDADDSMDADETGAGGGP